MKKVCLYAIYSLVVFLDNSLALLCSGKLPDLTFKFPLGPWDETLAKD